MARINTHFGRRTTAAAACHWLQARLAALILFIGIALAPGRASAELQFDVFLGYDGVIREAGWFPLMCEVFNDGASFNGVIEVSTGAFSGDQTKRVPVELPTNTRKRIFIPIFSSGGRFTQWTANLLDDKGKLRAERSQLQPKIIAWEGILLGAIPRTFAGMPSLPEARVAREELKPQVARFAAEHFPDNPIAIEGLTAVYLNSERAVELKVTQTAALLAWVRGGGHLIVAVEQLSDVTATPWLQQLLPVELTDMVNLNVDDTLQAWLKKPITRPASMPALAPQVRNQNQPGLTGNPYDDVLADLEFSGAQIPVGTGTLRDGTVEVEMGGKPLVVQAPRGRGQVTLLTFNPEREPFRSWKNKAWFWSRLAQVPGEWYVQADNPFSGGWSMDGVIGALIDSRQVRKLPVEWLLALLLVYLIVIGPFDHWILKKLNRQMLTWITFPAYVALFSVLIYFIGYKLRAGDTEWNELSMVDVMPRGEGRAELRGRTFASIYSSANANYSLSSELTFASLRGELLDLFGGGKEGSKASIEQRGNSFLAQISVPVWTSLLYVNDWFTPAAPPIEASFRKEGQVWRVEVENKLDRPLTEAHVVADGYLHSIGKLEPKQKRTVELERSKGAHLPNYIQQHNQTFQNAVSQRRNPLGDNQFILHEWPLTAIAASFPGQLGSGAGQRGFVWPAGLDLTPSVERGDVVVLAWDEGHSLVRPMNQFEPPRLRRGTLLRLTVPANSKTP